MITFEILISEYGYNEKAAREIMEIVKEGAAK